MQTSRRTIGWYYIDRCVKEANNVCEPNLQYFTRAAGSTIAIAFHGLVSKTNQNSYQEEGTLNY